MVHRTVHGFVNETKINKRLIYIIFVPSGRVIAGNVRDLCKSSGVSGLLFSIRVQVCRGRDNIVLQIGSNALNGSDRTCEEIGFAA